MAKRRDKCVKCVTLAGEVIRTDKAASPCSRPPGAGDWWHDDVRKI